VTIMQVRQGEAKGLGHAVLCAYPCIGNNAFAVVLPDVVLDEYTANQKTENLAAMIARYHATFASQIMVAPVPEEDVNKYGIADCGGVDIAPGDSAKIKAMVEKPDVGEAPSNLAVVGRYVLSEKIWRLLAKTPAGAGDEIQLTDAIDMLIEQDTVEAFNMTGKSHDCGDKLGYMNAFVEYGLRDAKLGADFKKSVEKMLLEQ
jgi:UTP--glucose-1-phosphate uridylyltransferase